jgi:prefoldin alpha subunit
MEEKNQQEQQEIMFKLSMFEQQIQQLQQQLQAVEKGIIDLSSLNLGLDEVVGKEGKEIFASIGKGIFAKAKLISEDLIVDIGSKNFVKKTIPETQELVKNQIENLEEVKKELNNNLESASNELRGLIQNVDKN